MNHVDLRVFDEEWMNAPAPENDRSFSVPDGRYTVEIKDVQLGTTQTGKPKIAFKMRVVDGEHQGGTVWKNMVITSNSLPYIRQDFALLNIDVRRVRMSQLPSHFPYLIGNVLEVEQKTKDKFKEVYFNRLVGAARQQRQPQHPGQGPGGNHGQGGSYGHGQPTQYGEPEERDDIPF